MSKKSAGRTRTSWAPGGKKGVPGLSRTAEGRKKGSSWFLIGQEGGTRFSRRHNPKSAAKDGVC